MIAAASWPPITGTERRWLFWSTGIVLVLSIFPYVLCALAAMPDAAFTGFLINPADGFTYLAKMRMGLRGNWIYHPPFTLERGPGAFMFTYYLALGHLARMFDLPLNAIFHIARLVGEWALLWTAYVMIACVTETVSLRRLMWWLVAFGAGLGWLSQKVGPALGFSYYEQQGVFYASLFYNLLANPHVPLAMAIMLMMFLSLLRRQSLSARGVAALSSLSFILAVLIPFMALVVYVVAGGTLAAIWWRDGRLPRAQATSVVIAGLITASFLLFMRWQINADFTLRALSTQASTPSPGLLGMLLGFGLLWPFAIVGMHAAWQRRSDWDLLLLAWIVLVIPLSYIPYHMQARFQMGLHIPIAIFAGWGLVRTVHSNWTRHLAVAAMMLTSVYFLIHLVVSKASVSVATVHYPLTYLSAHEAAALNWLRTSVPPSAAVLAGQEMNLFIPGFAGQRVVAGHHVESVDQPRMSKLVKGFFSGSLDRAQLLRELAIDYVVVGPRDLARNTFDPASLPVQLAFQSGDVSIYKVERAPVADGHGT